MKDLVSIIVPVYNGEKYICRCLDSLLNQSYDEIEILVVDNGSKDRSQELVERYVKNHGCVKLIIEPQKGVSFARNSALKQANGRYVGFCDADDWVEPTFVEKLISLMKKYSCGIGVCGYEMCGNSNKSVLVKAEDYVEICKIDDAFERFVLDETVGGFCWNKIFERELIKKIYFDEEMEIMEDLDFLCQILQNKKTNVCITSEKLYKYFIHDNNVSVTKEDDLSDNVMKFIYSLNRIINKHYVDNKKIYILEADVFRQASIVICRLKNNAKPDNRKVILLKDAKNKCWKYLIPYLRSNVRWQDKVKSIIYLITA